MLNQSGLFKLNFRARKTVNAAFFGVFILKATGFAYDPNGPLFSAPFISHANSGAADKQIFPINKCVPIQACDGDLNTHTGQVENATLDLGGTYVVDSTTVVFFGDLVKYCISSSLFFGGDTANNDFRPLLWVQSAKQTDTQKLPGTVARFLNFRLFATYHGGSTWPLGDASEIKVYGHSYVPSPTDELPLSRKKWTATGAGSKTDGEGPSAYRAFENTFNGPWIGTGPFIIDRNETSAFNQINFVFNTAETKVIKDGVSIFVSDDLNNWGNEPITCDYRDSTTKVLSKLYHGRYLKIVFPAAIGDYGNLDDIILLAPVDSTKVNFVTKISPHSRYQKKWKVISKSFTLDGKILQQIK